jgi:hypothetical protein
MAKYDEREGNSCHIHLSFRSADGDAVLAGDREHGFSALMERSSPASCLPAASFTYLLAPNINSYKAVRRGSFAPTAVAWGWTTGPARCAWSATAIAPVENRLPGGDVNPYLASPRSSPAACTASRRPRARAAAGGQRIRLRQGPRPVHAARGAATVHRLEDRPAAFGTRWSTTTPTPRGRARRVRRRRHRLGAVPWLRTTLIVPVVDNRLVDNRRVGKPRIGVTTYLEPATWASGSATRPAPAHLSRRSRRGRRAYRCCCPRSAPTRASWRSSTA